MDAYIVIGVGFLVICVGLWIMFHNPNKPYKPKGVPQITNCCDAGVVMKKVGNELVVVCEACHSYIGHVVSRDIGLLCFNHAEYIDPALRKRGDIEVMTEQNYDQIYDLYAISLQEFAPKAGKIAVEQMFPSE